MMSPLEGRNRVDGLGARRDAIAGAGLGSGDWHGFEGWPITHAPWVGWGGKASTAAVGFLSSGSKIQFF